MIIYKGNQSAISLAKHPQFYGKSKHIAIKYHFVKEQVSNISLELKYYQTNNMIADIMIKGLTGEHFEKLHNDWTCNNANHAGSNEKEC